MSPRSRGGPDRDDRGIGRASALRIADAYDLPAVKSPCRRRSSSHADAARRGHRRGPRSRRRSCRPASSASSRSSSNRRGDSRSASSRRLAAAAAAKRARRGRDRSGAADPPEVLDRARRSTSARSSSSISSSPSIPIRGRPAPRLPADVDRGRRQRGRIRHLRRSQALQRKRILRRWACLKMGRKPLSRPAKPVSFAASAAKVERAGSAVR